MNQNPSLIKRIAKRAWRILNTTRKVIINIVFFGVLLILFTSLSNSDNEIIVPEQSALVLDLNGALVEQKQEVDPMGAFIGEALDQPEENPEVLIADVVEIIDRAKDDENIALIVLKLDQLYRSGITKLSYVGAALERFKSSGKKVIAIGEGYSQDQYYLASYADEIWLDPKGWMLLDGYGRYQLYFKSALEKLSISQHIFRVGTYKSAVEPYMRDDMSPAAKEANQLWLQDLWSEYKKEVAARRGFDIANFDETTDTLVNKLKAANGSFAQYALENKWVDHLKSREQLRNALIEEVGKHENGETFKQINFKSYQLATTPAFPIVNPNSDKVAVIVAQGTILNGTQKAGTIGGDSTAKLLRRARFNDNVKAVVLRVDSPGGSAYASEVIRREIELLKESGKPVVASMGSMAASGGYWISAPANKIYASPTTITGSIGIFGFFMTFENTLDKIGIHTDGVGTTDIAGFGVTRPITQGIADIFQLNIERGYQDFINLVAENRNMTPEQVDKIAQGRVWSGSKAQELGLVDELGNLDDAVAEAAQIAGLEHFDKLLIEKELSAKDKFFRDMFGQAATWLPEQSTRTQGPVEKLLKQVWSEAQALNSLNDPQGVYSLCLTCEL